MSPVFLHRLPHRLVAVAALVAAVSVPAPTASAQTPSDRGPALHEPPAAMAAALRCHDAERRQHPEPVLLVHGITASAAGAWDWSWVPALNAAGVDVCTVDLPENGMPDNQRSAEYVVYAVRAMAKRYSAPVDIVGHSQGPITARWALRWWPDVRDQVDDLVSVVGANQGTQTADAACAAGSCLAGMWQLAPGSQFLAALNATDESPGAVDYTSLYTRGDLIVVPQIPASVSEIDGAVNVPLDTLCPGHAPEHLKTLADGVTFAAALDALTRDGPLDPARFESATCLQPFLPGLTPDSAAAHLTDLYVTRTPMFFGLTAERVGAEPPLRDYAR